MEEKQVIEWYKRWCKDTKRNGGILIGSSIKELLVAFSEFQKRNTLNK